MAEAGAAVHQVVDQDIRVPPSLSRDGVAQILHALQSLTPVPTPARTPKVPTILQRSGSAQAEGTMLHYAVVFFVIAIIAAVLGFGGLAAGAAGIAKILFIVFLVGAVITFLVGRSRV
jgi:uncharacterized membrane protein YtjA (UPF0391 family)